MAETPQRASRTRQALEQSRALDEVISPAAAASSPAAADDGDDDLDVYDDDEFDSEDDDYDLDDFESLSRRDRSRASKAHSRSLRPGSASQSKSASRSKSVGRPGSAGLSMRRGGAKSSVIAASMNRTLPALAPVKDADEDAEDGDGDDDDEPAAAAKKARVVEGDETDDG